jgi:type II secretion system protein C
VILTRNLFNASLLAPAAGGPIEEDLEATKLPLTLLGTVAALEPENAWAAIEDRETKQTRTVRVNDTVRAGATVQRIERKRVVLIENGSPRELVLSEEGTVQLAAVAPPRAAAAVPRPRRAPGPGFRQPAPAEVPPLDARNPAALFSEARILPKYENGQMVGVQLKRDQGGSMFEKIGIQNGDVIKELNGIKIDAGDADPARVRTPRASPWSRSNTQGMQTSRTRRSSRSIVRREFGEGWGVLRRFGAIAAAGICA